MNKKIFSVLLTVALSLSCIMCISAQSDNLFSNGGFEEELLGNADWKFYKTGGWCYESGETVGITDKEKSEGNRQIQCEVFHYSRAIGKHDNQ